MVGRTSAARVRVDPDDFEARELKAEELRQIGSRTPNSNWRNWYLTAARELDGTIDYSLAIDINATDQIGALPAAALLEGLRFRIDPNKAEGTTASAGFVVTDTDESIGLTIRNGVVETNTTIPNDADFVAELPKLVVMGMLFEDSTAVLPKAFDSGSGKLPRESLDDAARFFAYFDPKDTGHIHLSDR